LGLNGIPRRYSDYPDGFTTWNVVSSIGSTISIVSVFFFIMIVWEAFSSQRPVLFTIFIPTIIEWQHDLPPADHRYIEVPLFSY
jgi:cytochrome c oxidase subunit 1